MASTPVRGAGIPMSAPNTIYGLSSNFISLGAGRIYNIPAGSFNVQAGPYTFIQYLDPVTNAWQTFATDGASLFQLNSDGANYRLANLSGCPIRAIPTTAGSGYTNGIYVNGISTSTGLAGIAATASAGGSTWTCIIGGAISTTITVTSGGSGYSIAPNVIISAPPAGGVQATAIATISAGAVTSFTVTNQGAGYVTAPTVTIVPQPYDTATTAAVGTCTLTGSGTLTALYPNYHGTALTSLPTLSFAAAAGSSAAATVVMNWTVTGFTATAGGVAYGNAQPFGLLSTGGITAATSVLTNPTSQSGITLPRIAQITGTSTAGGAIQTTGSVIVDGGLGFQAIPSFMVTPAGNSLPTTIAQATATVGGVTDTSSLQPM